MKKLEINVDLDSIVVDFFGGLWEDYEKVTGERVTTDQILSWDMSKHVGDPQALVKCFYEPGFFRKLKPIPGAIEALKVLHDNGHEITILSSPCTAHCATEKLEWCAQHLPFIPFGNLGIFHKKHKVTGDVLIDDGLHNVQAYRKAHPDALICGIAYPYNEDPQNHYDLRAEGFKDPVGAWTEIVWRIEMRSAMRDTDELPLFDLSTLRRNGGY